MATSFAVSRPARFAASALIAAVAAIAAPTTVQAGSYGWPLKPFDRQHPVRGFFGDPRIGEAADGHIESKTFHFGIDISAPDGTAVFAIGVGQNRLGARASRNDRDQGRRRHRLRLLAYRPGRPQRRVRHRQPDAARPHLEELGSRPLRRTRRRPLREPAAARRDDALRGHNPADRSHIQLRARRQEPRRRATLRPFRPGGGDLGRHAAGGPGKVGPQAGHARRRPLAHPQRQERGDSVAHRDRLLDARSRRRACSTRCSRRGRDRTILASRPVSRGRLRGTGTADALRDGRHTLEVEAIDTRGNVRPELERRSRSANGTSS